MPHTERTGLSGIKVIPNFMIYHNVYVLIAVQSLFSILPCADLPKYIKISQVDYRRSS